MRPVLGIELGLSRCALVLADDRRAVDGTLHVRAWRVVQYQDSVSLALEVRRARLALGLPRRARVVVWPAPGDAGVVPADRPSAAGRFAPSAWRLREYVRPLVRAGFRISGIVTPAQALALRLGVDASPGAVVALAVDTRAGTLAVVDGGRALASRDLHWTIRAPEADAPLVDRYAFAAQVVPHLRDAIRLAAAHGVRVERVVLCGAVPALRALASPIIEDLDLEVETLDGVTAVTLDADAGADTIASLQLAAAVATAPPRFAALVDGERKRVFSASRLILGAMAAAVVVVALMLMIWPVSEDPAPRRSTVRTEGMGDARAGNGPDTVASVRYAQEDR